MSEALSEIQACSVWAPAASRLTLHHSLHTSIRTHAASSMLTCVSQQRRSRFFRLERASTWRHSVSAPPWPSQFRGAGRIRRATLHLYRSFVRRDTILDLSTIAQASHCSCARNRDVKFFLVESNRSSLTDADKVITHGRWCSDECPRRSPLRHNAEAASHKVGPS
jgi:hypothetical protein